ncbi:MAG: rhodanese-like domain-containing protein [Gammaproteobacteria bacterium]|nr:rhodanese-like domain-containing protein [Gammaproteobacteria bacterium]
MRSLFLSFTSMCFGLVMASANAASNEFPGRAEYPDIPVFEIAELKNKIAEVVVVDTRSKYEYDTLRIKGSIHIPVAAKSFEQDVQKLRAGTDKPIVFYCNGRTCYKSYLAVKKAQAAGIKNTFAYDAGIFEWVKSEPKKSELLGKSPVMPGQLIDAKIYQARLLEPNEFSERILSSGGNSMVLDVRDMYQRAGVGFYPGIERWVSLDDKAKLAKYLEKAKASKQTLFIYDEVGAQVQWLQYALEDMGIKDYYFMNKGAKAYYASISSWK